MKQTPKAIQIKLSAWSVGQRSFQPLTSHQAAKNLWEVLAALVKDLEISALESSKPISQVFGSENSVGFFTLGKPKSWQYFR